MNGDGATTLLNDIKSCLCIDDAQRAHLPAPTLYTPCLMGNNYVDQLL